MNENLTPYPADDSLQRAKAETDELLRELDKLRQASKQECQQLYFRSLVGVHVLPSHLASNDYQRGFFDGYVAGKVETLAMRREKSEPCDLCRHAPPSSGDGKPCTMCPAMGRIEEDGDNP